ncbi:MAG TPA: hypothetical protein VK721_12320 [Solirubrobacteraceae bacterium]|jgi:hypothetical protein|nr:hypothetical protein [Solirubrobacteraceae bacterium]
MTTVVWIATIVGAAGSAACAWIGIRPRWEMRRRRNDLRRSVWEWEMHTERRFREARIRYGGHVEIEERTGEVQVIRHREGAYAPPRWALAWMSSEDACRYQCEWSAHLHQLIEEGEGRQAWRDRRRLALAAISFAIVLRLRRALGRAR